MQYSWKIFSVPCKIPSRIVNIYILTLARLMPWLCLLPLAAERERIPSLLSPATNDVSTAVEGSVVVQTKESRTTFYRGSFHESLAPREDGGIEPTLAIEPAVTDETIVCCLFVLCLTPAESTQERQRSDSSGSPCRAPLTYLAGQPGACFARWKRRHVASSFVIFVAERHAILGSNSSEHASELFKAISTTQQQN